MRVCQIILLPASCLPGTTVSGLDLKTKAFVSTITAQGKYPFLKPQKTGTTDQSMHYCHKEMASGSVPATTVFIPIMYPQTD